MLFCVRKRCGSVLVEDARKGLVIRSAKLMRRPWPTQDYDVFYSFTTFASWINSWFFFFLTRKTKSQFEPVTHMNTHTWSKTQPNPTSTSLSSCVCGPLLKNEEVGTVVQSAFNIYCMYPTNNALLINFRLSFDAEILLIKHRLSIQIGAKRAKTCMRCVYVPTELQFCIPPLVVV